MATLSEITAALDAAFAGYFAELALAGPHWETKPSAGDGEEGWCARQVAEHVAGSGIFFGSSIAQMAGIAGPAPEQVQLPDFALAEAETHRAQGVLMGVIGSVPEASLSIAIDHPRLGKQTVGSIMQLVATHTNDHAAQLRALRGA